MDRNKGPTRRCRDYSRRRLGFVAYLAPAVGGCFITQNTLKTLWISRDLNAIPARFRQCVATCDVACDFVQGKRRVLPGNPGSDIPLLHDERCLGTLKPGRDGFGNHFGIPFHGAFPDHCDAPVGVPKVRHGSSVPRNIGVEFRLPELGSGSGSGGVSTSGMTMPETAVHKDHGVPLSENYVGSSRKPAMVEAKPIAAAVERTT